MMKFKNVSPNAVQKVEIPRANGFVSMIPESKKEDENVDESKIGPKMYGEPRTKPKPIQIQSICSLEKGSRVVITAASDAKVLYVRPNDPASTESFQKLINDVQVNSLF